MPDKNRPSPEWIAGLRRRFKLEHEIDRVLTRKLERRGSAGWRSYRLDELAAATAALIRARLGAPVAVSSPRWLSGGLSNLHMAFELSWAHPERGPMQSAMLLRMEPGESLHATSRLREFQVMRAMHGVVPVPPVYWLDAIGEFLPEPGLICGFVPGIPAPLSGRIRGDGRRVSRVWRETLGAAFACNLARLHARRPCGAGLDAFDAAAGGTRPLVRELDHWQRVWEEDCDEDVPLVSLASAWLREHMPVCAEPVILHGDYRIDNVLLRPAEARIAALLDWELSWIGDHHFDLACATHPLESRADGTGGPPLIGGLMPEGEFCAAYMNNGGRAIDEPTLHYYKIFCAWRRSVVAHGSAWRVAINGKSHVGPGVTRLIGLSYRLLAVLRELLERA